MDQLQELIAAIIKFRDERDWGQYNNPKDNAMSLVLEAAEVMEHFQWKSKEEINDYILSHKDNIAEELSDVLYWVLLMSHDLKIDILDAAQKKLTKNIEKYPVEKAKGKHDKYNQL